MSTDKCVSPTQAKENFKNVKINISGASADNALDLLMNSLNKNLKNISLEEFKGEIAEVVANKKQKAGKKSRKNKGKRSRRTKRGRGPGSDEPSKKRKVESISSGSVYENAIAMISNVLTTIIIIVLSGGTTAGIIGIVNQLPQPYGTIFHALTGALYTCENATGIVGSVQYSMRLVASYATGGMISSCSTNALSYERSLMYAVGLLIANLGITAAMTRQSIYNRVHAFLSRQNVEQSCPVGSSASTANSTTSSTDSSNSSLVVTSAPETEVPVVENESTQENNNQNEDVDAANALLNLKKGDPKSGGKKSRRRRSQRKSRKQKKTKKNKKSRKSRKSRK